MTEQEARNSILQAIAITRQKIVIAKAFIIKEFHSDTTSLLNQFLVSVDARTPEKVVLHDSVDVGASTKAVAESFSWRLAFGEAILQLMHGSIILDRDSSKVAVVPNVQWTTVVPGSGGHSSGWRFDELSFDIPRRISLAPSQKTDEYQPLSDPDLFMHELAISGLNPEIELALREAVRCFRHDLYIAALAMLGKASEGAWIELGSALAAAIPPSAKFDSEKTRERFLDPFVGIGKKILDALKLYEDHRIPEAIRKNSGVRVQDLRNAVIWADAVRESRNSIHYGAEPPMTNCYEKVAALLIGAIPNFRLISELRSNIEKEVTT
jgi:hypothetical protein